MEEGTFIFPTKEVWQEPVVKVGDDRNKKTAFGKRSHPDILPGKCLDLCRSWLS